MPRQGFDPNAMLRVEGRREVEPRKAPQNDEAAAKRREVMRQRLDALVARLTNLAQEQVTKKDTIEQRWLADLRQYHGRYDADTEAALSRSDTKKSRLFANMTRPKTHAWEAKLSDMLFPADDKNWGIKATPVPELQDIVDQGRAPVESTAIGGAEPPQPSQAAVEAQAEIDRAKAGAKAMSSEIEDQLKESNYNANMREVIENACRIGTGISKGPTLTNRTRRRWTREADEGGNVVHLLAESEDPRPDNTCVDPWSFFPDMSATKIEDAGFAFQRYLYNPKQVRKLRKQPGFDHPALRTLLQEGPQEGYPTYITQLREITGAGQDTLKERFHVWEYHGPIEREDLEAILESTGKPEELDDYDPLEEINVIVWFCQGHLLKFGEQPLESGDHLYSVFSFARDETSMFGYGVPYLMRDSQAALNGGWRMMMDNAGLSVGPQIVVDRGAVEPADGSWELTPRKVWYKIRSTAPGDASPFQVFNIPNNQQELLAIINLALQFADDETNLPAIEQRSDEKTAHVTRTAMGMAILMNAINVVFRRVVKNFDDDMTVPNIRRMYDWNMQFAGVDAEGNQTGSKDHIKGDFEVDARGSSVLLVREMQAQNLMVMADRFSSHPVLGRYIKAPPLLRKTVESHMLSPNDLVMTDDEIRAAEEKEAQSGEQDPEALKLQMQFQIAEMEMNGKLQVAQLERETKLMTLAETNNMTVAKLQTMLGIKQIETDSKERMLAVEGAMEERMAAAGKTGGSGGFLSAGGGA